jgi:[ribosomal protein S5]-alanine N-acetyltransferase
MLEISSSRLQLIPLDHHLLTLWHTQGRNVMEQKMGLNPSDWQITDLYQRETIDALENYWLPMTNENFIDFMWFTNWEIVLKDQNLSIGGIGFAGLPDQEGKTMTGYMIDAKFHQQGFATEALACLLEWGKMDTNLKIVNADTPIDNIGSQKVLVNNGFVKIGQSQVEHTEVLEVYNWQLVVR